MSETTSVWRKGSLLRCGACSRGLVFPASCLFFMQHGVLLSRCCRVICTTLTAASVSCICAAVHQVVSSRVRVLQARKRAGIACLLAAKRGAGAQAQVCLPRCQEHKGGPRGRVDTGLRWHEIPMYLFLFWFYTNPTCLKTAVPSCWR